MNFIKHLFTKEQVNNQTFNQEDTILVDAHEAFESTKQPQLRNTIKKINDNRGSGWTYTYLDTHEGKPHIETISALLEKGYDVSISKSRGCLGDEPNWFNKVYWDDCASGIIRRIEGVTLSEWPEIFELQAQAAEKAKTALEVKENSYQQDEVS